MTTVRINHSCPTYLSPEIWKKLLQSLLKIPRPQLTPLMESRASEGGAAENRDLLQIV